MMFPWTLRRKLDEALAVIEAYRARVAGLEAAIRGGGYLDWVDGPHGSYALLGTIGRVRAAKTSQGAYWHVALEYGDGSGDFMLGRGTAKSLDMAKADAQAFTVGILEELQASFVAVERAQA